MIINDAAKEQVPDLSITTNSLGKSPIHQRHSDADVALRPRRSGAESFVSHASYTYQSLTVLFVSVALLSWVRPQLLMVCLHASVLDAF